MNKQILKELEKLADRYPDQRFGQLLFNYTRIGTRIELGTVADPFHYQDEDILNDLKKVNK